MLLKPSAQFGNCASQNNTRFKDIKISLQIDKNKIIASVSFLGILSSDCMSFSLKELIQISES